MAQKIKGTKTTKIKYARKKDPDAKIIYLTKSNICQNWQEQKY